MHAADKIVREKNRVSGGITDAERAALKAHSEMWIARAMRTRPVDVAEITSAVEDLYASAGLKKPRVVVCPSPLVMAFAYGASAAILHMNKATDAATYAATDAATSAATYAATDAATRAATDAATYAATSAARACMNLAGQFGIECAARWVNVYQGGAYWAPYDCYISAFRDVLGLSLLEHVKYAAWERCAIAAPFRVVHEDFCIVSDFPEVLQVDGQNRPHCATGPSHRWRDGWALYHWHGVQIPAGWIETKGALTASVALAERNIERRRAACEILGWAKILRDLNARTIDADKDPLIGTLVEVDLPDVGKARFLRVTCGTGREFAISVPPTTKTALAAQAWMVGLKSNQFKAPEIRT